MTFLLVKEAYCPEFEAFLLRLKVSLDVENIKFPWARGHFHHVYRNWMNGMIGFDFNAEPFLIYLIERLISFAIIFGFEAIRFGVFRQPCLLVKNTSS